jgi:hypothetical protein
MAQQVALYWPIMLIIVKTGIFIVNNHVNYSAKQHQLLA